MIAQPPETGGGSLDARLDALVRRVHGVYGAIVHTRGEVVSQAGATTHGAWVVPLGLALLDGGCAGRAPGFDNAHLAGPQRALVAHRLGADHVFCILFEPRLASAPLIIQNEVAILRALLVPAHQRLARVP